MEINCSYELIRKIKRSDSGFTMLEVIAVIIIIGILAAIVVSRIASTQEFSVTMEADILKSNLRYAQIRALSDNTTWGISFTGNSYTLLQGVNPSKYNLPNENSATHNLPSGFSVSGNTVTFDEWGSPGTNVIAINISAAGETKAVTVTQNTGFIK